jgi:hypothetical protein
MGTQNKIGASMKSTFANLRGGMGPQTDFGQQNRMANAGVYAPGSFGAQNAVANGTGIVGTPEEFQAAQAAQTSLGGGGGAGGGGTQMQGGVRQQQMGAPAGGQPGLFQAGLPTPTENRVEALSPMAQTFGSLERLGGVADANAFQTQLRDTGINLNPVGQAPGDFMRNTEAAMTLFRSGGRKPLVPTTAYAPTGLREKAIAAGGQSVFGQGAVMASYDGINAQGGRRFSLGQVTPRMEDGRGPDWTPPNPITPSPVRPASSAQPAMAQPNSSPAQMAEAEYRSAMNPGSGEVITAPGGERFMRDRNGRLQPAGSDPEITSQVKQKEAAAAAEGTKSVETAYKLLDEVGESANTGRALVGSIKRVRDLYDEGATSGFGQGALTTIGAAISRITGKEAKISSQQELNQALGELALGQTKEFAKGGGSVSNYERELFAEAGVNKSRTPEANLRILSALENVAKRNVALDNERTRLEGLGLPATEIAKELRQMRSQLTAEADKGYQATQSQAKTKKVGRFEVVEEP